MPHAELVEFLLPCETCNTLVTIRSDRAIAFIDEWLDGERTVRCANHR